ncbi:MAG: hypothetical protein CXX80_03050 [Methanobacteriota archaeon]|nr:MAG: hypothetical protein CXX80_03050 [Euryarchaeota archaeon]
MSGRDELLARDGERLAKEIENYQTWLDEHAEECYQLAQRARQQGLDHTLEVEIPRASDLASRTEKLLINHLDGVEIADDIRTMLETHDREITAITMAQKVARHFREEGHDTVKSIDVGLRVGLAILTEAVLVAPLEGISEVRLLHNIDGSPFLSLHFAGPIRAAGGTAQALAVLIGDMIRRDLGIGPYLPTTPEVERVKEEFGLYRGNLQYRPPPDEIDTIVRACPVMINGESTESIECSGFGECRNVDEARIRGGVLLVIGEGLCLKAPKIQKHTERLRVPGWEFISAFAAKGGDDAGNGVQARRQIKPVRKFMNDIIAGRPVFGEPSNPGGFRLRYGRPRTSGLAAGSLNPVSMRAMDDFLTVGTQMKIERPGKACAVTPCDEADGPWLLLEDGRFLRVDDEATWERVGSETLTIWDNGELVLGFGEFLENNKRLVPSAYSNDWWASDLLDALDDKGLLDFIDITGLAQDELPDGAPASPPGGSVETTRKKWHQFLRALRLNWPQAKAISHRFATSMPPPHNPWWADLPLEWIEPMLAILQKSHVENGVLRIVGGVKGWDPSPLLQFQFEEFQGETPGPEVHLCEPLLDDKIAEMETLRVHGLPKASALVLGLAHHHDGDDLLITSGWEALLEGLGFGLQKGKVEQIVDARIHLQARSEKLLQVAALLKIEEVRRGALDAKKAQIRIAAETDARQKGYNIGDTERMGKEAMDEVLDPGPDNPLLLDESFSLEDEHRVDGAMWLVRKTSELRWEHSAPVRIGTRMARPEKAAPREMRPAVHSLFPIGMAGGPQRRLAVAADKGILRVQVRKRFCVRCDAGSGLLTCIAQTSAGEVCGGRCEPRTEAENSTARRMGVMQSLPIQNIIDAARNNLDIRMPQIVKCVKGLMSKGQTPEALEKGILRAAHRLPVFRDGTIRFDMSDVPITHFRPREINVSIERLRQLGYTIDVDGQELRDGEQVVELYPQDFIVSKRAEDFLLRTTQFVDDLLVRFYGLEPFYNCQTADDLVGHLTIAIAPHTSGGVLSRIIGWSDCSGGYAHPLFHASKRRNCDGDEDAIMMLLDGLLNFSREILPANRGGQMDAPLVLTTRINPTEVDKEALNVDCAWYYPSAFYEATLSQPQPKEVLDLVDIVDMRIDTPLSLRGYGYTHDCHSLDAGPALSAYKTLETMVDKMNGQLEIGRKLRAVDVRTVASSVVRSHFLPDLRGNLVAFTRQKIRCMKCAHSYRRLPLAGKCIQTKKGGDAMAGVGLGNLALTVTEGAVRKYINVTGHVVNTYGVDNYTKQNIEWLAKSVESLFNNDRARQASLFDFI